MMRPCLGLPGRRCGRLIKSGSRCLECQRALYRLRNAQRDPWARAFYHCAAWRRLADAVVAAADRCAWYGTPKGIVQLTAGHIVGIAQDRSLAFEPSNVAAMATAPLAVVVEPDEFAWRRGAPTRRPSTRKARPPHMTFMHRPLSPTLRRRSGRPDRARMRRLVDRELRAPGHGHRGDGSPSLHVDRSEGRAGGSQVGNRAVQVVAHEVELVAGFFRRVDGDLRGRQREYEPPPARIDAR